MDNAPEPEVALPETIGSFRILEKLGQGGMGSVYRAMHGTLERPVALKILPPELASNPEYVTRFLREARTIATLRHENVVQVYDAGEQNGQYFIAMELVDGANLIHYVENKQRISEHDGMLLMLQAARGLAAAHAKGLVHRDIKPENMLIGKDNILRIVDFGLVMESNASHQLTMAGTFLGTPMYMSPEQVDGEQADGRSDIYSLGISFFRIFTGQAPFVGSSVMNVLYKHKFEAPPDPKTLRADLSSPLCDLLLKMIKKKREERPASAAELVKTIENMLPSPAPLSTGSSGNTPAVTGEGRAALDKAGKIVFSGLPGAEDQDSTFFARHTRLLIGGVAVVLVVVLLLIGLTGRGVAPPPARPQVTAPGVQTTETPAPHGGVPAPAPLVTPINDHVAKADALFQSQRYEDAIAIYREVLEVAPKRDDVKAKLQRAERAVKFNNLMKDGVTQESKGNLEAAVDSFNAALALDDSGGAQAALKRVNERQDRIKEALASAERDKLAAAAVAAEQKGDLETAGQKYDQAAERSTGAEKVRFAGLAQEARRRYLCEQGKAAADKDDLKTAEASFARAQEIKNDPIIAQRLDQIRATLKIRETRSQYDALLKAGQALMSTDLAQAREKLLAAQKLKASSEVELKLKEVEGRELLALGDAERDKKNAKAAEEYYGKAVEKCFMLLAEAKDRIEHLKDARSVGSDVMARVDYFIKAQRDANALREVTDGLLKEPANAALLEAKAGLENLQAATAAYTELGRLIGSTISYVRVAADIETDEKTQPLLESIEALRSKINADSKKARPAFVAHNYEAVAAALQAAKAHAGELAGVASNVAAYYANAHKKPERFQEAVDGLKTSVQQAKALQK